MLNLQELNELRKIFRQRFKEVDFCIGEEQVEKLFRELLGEAEPVYRNHVTTLDPNVAKILERELDRMLPKIKDIFNRDDAFYRHMKK